MCYFIYANINKEAYRDEFFKVCDQFKRPYDPIAEKDIPFTSDITGGVFFRLTRQYCDCSTKLGRGFTRIKELDDYYSWLKALKTCRNVKYLCLVKYWEGSDRKSSLEPTITIHIDDMDAAYLSRIKDDTFYKIQLFKRYY